MALSLSSEEIVTYSFEAALLRDVLLSSSNSNNSSLLVPNNTGYTISYSMHLSKYINSLKVD